MLSYKDLDYLLKLALYSLIKARSLKFQEITQGKHNIIKKMVQKYS